MNIVMDAFPSQFLRFLVADAQSVLDIVQRMNWVVVGPDGCLRLTATGSDVIGGASAPAVLKRQLRDVVLRDLPQWSGLIPRGRNEAVRFMPQDVKQCFDEAHLSTGTDPDTVSWWDELASVVRGRRDDTALQIGRNGERLTIEYESVRTGRVPRWQSIETNLSGYDVLSSVSVDDLQPLRIEVKASSMHKSSASFHVTKSEWRIACEGAPYVFHLWLLHPEPMLRIATVDSICEHIPTNRGMGEWESTRIPFNTVSE